MVDLGKQIGPLPLGAWIVVVGGGLGIALFSRNQSANADPVVMEDIGGVPGVGTGEVGGWTQTQPPPSSPEPAITDNESWGREAINYLIAQGYNPAWAYAAITKALAGGRGTSALSPREYALWNRALSKLGSPPYAVEVPPPASTPGPVAPPRTGGAPAPTPSGPAAGLPRHKFEGKSTDKNGRCAKKFGSRTCNLGRYNNVHFVARSQPAPGSYRYAVVAPKGLRGHTLKSLSQVYYGTENRWNDIYQANRTGKRRADGTPGIIDNPNRLRVGTRLIIPR